MKINFANLVLSLVLPASMAMAQVKPYTPVYFDQTTENTTPFTNKEKKFNDWAVSIGIGTPLIQAGDMTSINNGNGQYKFGYAGYISVDKAITHAFGLNLQYEIGETKQQSYNGIHQARTNYQGLSLLGDVNFSNLFRRVDNNSHFRWALHGYLGLGTLGYKAYRADGSAPEKLISDVKAFQKLNSLFLQGGAGVKYKINNRIDLEGRGMYVYTGDDQFDGGGEQYSPINRTEDQVSDNFLRFTLGATVKLGKHQSHLFWHDPLQEIYYKLDMLSNKNTDVVVCKKGDGDNDGVCDDWDRQLDTPAGARVDGSGVALDTDLDGVIDLNDKCVTVPGPASNFGCPLVADKAALAVEIERSLKDILFVFNTATIIPESYPKLDLAADIIKSSNGGTYLLIGQTDKKGTDSYNLALSKRRAAAVVAELERRGVAIDQLKSKGVGEAYATIPESASDAERQEDRRVSVKYVTGAEWDAIPKNDIVTKKAPVKKTVRKK